MKSKHETAHNKNIALLLNEFGHEHEERIRALYYGSRNFFETDAKIHGFIPHRAYKKAREICEAEYKNKITSKSYTI
jgi:hypothetical protein